MGYVHHSNYARYYETARWELFRRKLNISYKNLEDQGFMLPVTDMTYKFIKPARYDELLTIETTLAQLKGPRIAFRYRMFNEQKELINQAEVVLACVDKVTRKPCRIPGSLVQSVQKEIATELETN